MFSLFDSLRDLTFAAVAARMVLAFLCGGAIGIEREYKRRSAGFRTHILICLGASMTTLTSQYLYLYMNYYTDMARLGAQVVAGIGFIGAGTIIVTRRQRVTGLTTAAGLWASAIVGLSIGAGFYEGGIYATLLILLAEMFFSRLEYWIFQNSAVVNYYVEYTDKTCLDAMLQFFQDENVKVMNMEITRSIGSEHHNACVIFSLRLNRNCPADRLSAAFQCIDGVLAAEEL